ncbi:putative 2-oxo-4-hydroxy-4-carboxy-5-ureidoimidazoline decarboxylase [Hyla sarda]|uniref:putative 2-oxo-4-hydroxy-4-carboxy-5-ureidoimidazoline decarboxylase n=1 Tax=Hyla sarda TaxID=327740 RepID=UPI0024C2FF10|nr:putative 2-oxo-4-hydroxy-4-carboxy-5-ureidoimidazoline decarboxylase [Hyla sarda]
MTLGLVPSCNGESLLLGQEMDLEAVNSMSYEQFLDIFGNIIEKCPIITAAVWSRRPYSAFSEVEDGVYEFIEALPKSGKEGILRCHPDLAGRELTSGALTMESQQEQRQAGLTSLTSGERERMTLLNARYKEKFGFPFVICAKLSDKHKIMEELTARLHNDPSAELLKGIEEVKKICHLRLQDILCRGSLVPTKL